MDIAGLSGVRGLKRPRETQYCNGNNGVTSTKRTASLLSTDVVDISSSSKDTRSLLLDSVRSRIRSGYYSRDSVADDISDKLSRLFDR